MKKLFCGLLIFVLIFFSSNFVFGNENISVKAKSGISINKNTGEILWEKNSNEKYQIASTTKIMTAILAIENSNLEDIVIVTPYAASIPPSKMYLKKGEKIKMEYLLYALLLESSNDAAVAIGDYIGGTETNFAKMMTNKAKEIGAINTLYQSASGLDAGLNPYSTAYDLGVIMKYALENENLVKIMNTKNIYFESNLNKYNIRNQNLNLKEIYPSIIGKTGYTKKANHVFVSYVNENGHEIITVVLKTDKEGKWTDTKIIIEYSKNILEERKKTAEIKKEIEILIPKIIIEFRTDGGIRLGDLILEERKIKLKLELNQNNIEEINIELDFKKRINNLIENEKLGKINVFLENEIIYSEEVFYNENNPDISKIFDKKEAKIIIMKNFK